jgi:hypothetical protein
LPCPPKRLGSILTVQITSFILVLEESTSYSIQVQAVNNVGIGNSSDPVLAETTLAESSLLTGIIVMGTIFFVILVLIALLILQRKVLKRQNNKLVRVRMTLCNFITMEYYNNNTSSNIHITITPVYNNSSSNIHSQRPPALTTTIICSLVFICLNLTEASVFIPICLIFICLTEASVFVLICLNLTEASYLGMLGGRGS